ncbi:GH17500 [Drosophila grimshawi]|uniref:GH17500 n=2 Tax=Drosophila grimshawi TaxID=7222 RepID=B4JTW6_DROGR|nr:GH17500 [Drosophila grimshawi]
MLLVPQSPSGLSANFCKMTEHPAVPAIIGHGLRQSRKRRQTRYSNQATGGWIFLAFLMLVFSTMELVECALRNVNLIIEPPAVRQGQHVVLRCMYDLDGAPLYSAKFYRGQLEFYRYTPGEFPNTKVFPFPGIHVDVTNSNATQVLIRNVGFGLSGNFSCEVTADAPLFSTATALGIMQVVELPDKRPTLYTEHTRYEPGDVLRANCSTPPSRPRVELKFTINNMVITNAETQFIRTIDNLIASRISLKLQLQGVHFSSVNPAIYNNGYGLNSVYGHGGPMYAPNPGGLVLRCTAQIGDLYQEYKEVELGTPQKDPVPARVTLSSGSSMKNFFSTYFSTSAASRRVGGVHLAPITMALAALLVSSGALFSHIVRELVTQLVPIEARPAIASIAHSKSTKSRLSTLFCLQGANAAAGKASSEIVSLGASCGQQQKQQWQLEELSVCVTN